MSTVTTISPVTETTTLGTTVFGLPDFQIGGYLPFIDLPCERWIGESIWWTILLATSSPVTCSLIPWLCCPAPFELNDPFTISSTINCFNINAEMGAYIFWTMQGISIFGLVLSMFSLGVCGLHEATDVEDGPNVVFNTNFTEAVSTLFNLTVEDSKTKTIQEAVMDIVKKAIVMEEYSKKKSYNLEKKHFLKNNSNSTIKVREKRHVNEHLRIPILPQLYTGNDEFTDYCERHEVMHMDGECCEILSQGPCEDDEFVIIDEKTQKGICVPRLCSPDRVFIFEDQRCHDPFEKDICPTGRQLTTSLYGTPVCICPDGTYEEEEDSDDDDVCQPILGRLESCSAGYVFWFSSFRSRPSCLPDPCSGLNSKKGLNEMPFVPSAFDGQCYQIGKELPQCPSDKFYTLSFDSLKGICASLEDAGYLVADDESENFFRQLYGAPLPRDIGSNSMPAATPNSRKVQRKAHIRAIVHYDDNDEKKSSKLLSKAINSKKAHNSKKTSTKKQEGRSSKKQSFVDYLRKSSVYFYKSSKKRLMKKQGNEIKRSENEEENEEEEEEEEEETQKSRRKRDASHCASLSTVFEPSLAACKAGAVRGFNKKCRTRILPIRLPLSRPRRTVRVEPPVPICPNNSFYSIRRRCVSKRGPLQTNLLSRGLG